MQQLPDLENTASKEEISNLEWQSLMVGEAYV